jgi:hypothetical protein
VVREHLAAIQHGDQEAAYGFLSEGLKSQMPLDQFVELVAAHPALRNMTQVKLESRSWNPGRVQLGFALTASAGEQESVQYTLVSETAGWRIAAIEFLASPPSP